MNSSTTEGVDPKPRFPDHAKLFLAAIACGVSALLVLPFEPPILKVCDVHPLSPTLGLWDWFDRSAPAVLMTASLALGVLVMLFARPSEKSRRAAAGLLLAFVIALLLAGGLKLATKRDRPLANPARAGALWSPLDLRDDKSFPSGHVAGGTAIAAALWLASRRRSSRNVVWAIPAMLMLDRLCLAVHWPSDVLGGAAIGLFGAGVVAFAARLGPADRAMARFGRGGSPLARFLMVALAWLVITRFWGELPLGRDPVSGVVVPGFETEPHRMRIILEPIVGPVLHLGLEDLRAIVLPLVLWSALTLFLVLLSLRDLRRKTLVVAGILLAAWITVFLTGWAPPDRFVAKDRKGVFVDWHLHGGDPFDGTISKIALNGRETSRGVHWPILTHHGRIEEGLVINGSLNVQRGVSGTEWSGPLPARGESWRTAHVLILGEFGPTLEETATHGASAVDAARVAVSQGALVIPAHFWRSQATIPDCPTFEDLVLAGVHGFEVGNRHRETDPAAVERLRDLDRKCREKGLLRFSFSDDHGIPAGSPCVTFLEGVDERGLAVIQKLRSAGGGGITPIPLLFFPGDPTLVPPRWLAPPVMAFEYFRSLRFSQRASWFVFAALAGLLLFGVRRRSYTPQ